jgi:very-short-patch-repair endonuclease
VATTGVPKTLKPFVDKDFSVATTLVEVTANNSPHKGRNIVTYSSDVVEAIMRAYTTAVGNNLLQKNQMHVGRRCVLLLSALVQTALETAIKEACGLPTNIQQTAQKHYTDIVELMTESGFKCSVNDEIAIKIDITDFLQIPLSTLNSYLSKHRETIKPIQLEKATIRAIGSKASRLNGYHIQDVGTIALGMDSVVGIGLKEKMFGSVSRLAKWETKGEIEWQQVLADIFAGFSFYHNYQIGPYRVDFYIKELNLILECNGYDGHANYNQLSEMEREQFFNQSRLVRFHYLTDWKVLINAILHAKVGTVTRLYPNVDFDTTTSSTIRI